MIYYITAALAAQAVLAVLIASTESWVSDFAAAFIVPLLIATVLGIVLCVPYYGSSYKAEILNSEYDTEYTPAQVFFGGDIIEEIRNVQRKRIEVNGDLFRDEADD